MKHNSQVSVYHLNEVIRAFLMTAVVIIAFCLFAGVLYAQQPGNQEKLYDLQSLTTLPDGQTISEADYQAKSLLFEQLFPERDNLNFSVRLPERWEEGFLNTQEINDLNASFLTDLGRFASPPYGDKRAFFTVQAMLLKKEIFAEDWFRNQVLTNSYNVKTARIYSNKEIEALYTALEGNIAFAVRAKVIITGDILFFVRYATPVDFFAQRADVQARAMQSFTLLNPREGAIEKERRFAVLNALSLYYPASWQVKEPDFSNLDHLKVELHRIERGNITFGRILIEAVRKTKGDSLQDHIQTTIQSLKKRGYELDGLLEQRNATLPAKFGRGLIEVYKTFGDNDDLEQEFWFSLFENEDYYYFFTMLTPTRRVAYEDWARNRAAFLKILANVD